MKEEKRIILVGACGFPLGLACFLIQRIFSLDDEVFDFDYCGDVFTFAAVIVIAGTLLVMGIEKLIATIRSRPRHTNIDRA